MEEYETDQYDPAPDQCCRIGDFSSQQEAEDAGQKWRDEHIIADL